MAIQGYTPTGNPFLMSKIQSIFGPGANDQILSDMLSLFGLNITPAQAQGFLADLLAKANASGYPNLLDENGVLDIGLLYNTGSVPSIFEQCDIIGQPDGTFYAMVIRGRWTIIANQDVYINIMAQIAQNVPTEITAPVIEFVSHNFGLGMDWITGESPPGEVVSFCATFLTKYGETGASNVLMSPITASNAWQCQIGLSKEPHSLVEKVFYYRTFNGNFRRVKEVVIGQ